LKKIGLLRASGKSTRQIARKTGVSQSQVQRDLAGVSGDTPEAVKGQDGKTYPASKPATAPGVPQEPG
jgi:hypothetical protein